MYIKFLTLKGTNLQKVPNILYFLSSKECDLTFIGMFSGSKGTQGSKKQLLAVFSPKSFKFKKSTKHLSIVFYVDEVAF